MLKIQNACLEELMKQIVAADQLGLAVLLEFTDDHLRFLHDFVDVTEVCHILTH